MSEISSGLVAVAEVGAGFSLRWTEPDYGCSCKHYDMLVRLSDAEAIILDLQNLVTAENQRKQQFEAEIESLRAQVAELSDAFTVIWVSDDHAAWDGKAVEHFDALLAKVGGSDTATHNAGVTGSGAQD